MCVCVCVCVCVEIITLSWLSVQEGICRVKILLSKVYIII